MATRLTECDAPVITGISSALREHASGPKHMAEAKVRLKCYLSRPKPPKRPSWLRRILKKLRRR